MDAISPSGQIKGQPPHSPVTKEVMDCTSINPTPDSYPLEPSSPVDENRRTPEAFSPRANNHNNMVTPPRMVCNTLDSDLTPRTTAGFLRENTWLRQELKRLQQDLSHTIEENTQLHARIQKLQNELLGEHKERNEQELLLQEAQQKAYTSLENPMWMFDTEKIIRGLDQFEKHLKRWCKQYASTQALGELMAGSNPLQNSVMHLLRPGNDGRASGLFGVGMQSKATSMLLLSCLTDFLFSKIFENPFYFLDSRMKIANNISADQIDVPNLLGKEHMRMYLEALSCDESEAHNWRVQTLRVLSPRSSTQDPEKMGRIARTNRITQEAILGACASLASQFLNSSMGLLVDKKHGQVVKQSLCEIFHEAGGLSYYIATQKVDLHIARLDDFHTQVFHHRNPFIEAHSSHQIQLDDDEASLDGQQIHLVLHPAIIVFGNADGTDYHKSTIWKKAVVWMGESR